MALKDEVQVKLEAAEDKAQAAMSLCTKQCSSPSPRTLLKIGSCVGDLVNNLRSALNYVMVHFVKTTLKPVITAKEYKHLKHRVDFPWATSKSAFDSKLLVALTKGHCSPVYDCLEGTQPYNTGKEWLGHLMRISNQDKHVIITDVLDAKATAVAFMDPDGRPHPAPGFFGPDLDRVLVKSLPQPHVHLCPFYYYPYGGFAVQGGKWVFFLVPIDQHTQLGLTRFLETAPGNVAHLVDDFVALI